MRETQSFYFFNPKSDEIAYSWADVDNNDDNDSFEEVEEDDDDDDEIYEIEKKKEETNLSNFRKIQIIIRYSFSFIWVRMLHAVTHTHTHGKSSDGFARTVYALLAFDPKSTHTNSCTKRIDAQRRTSFDLSHARACLPIFRLTILFC